MPSRLCVFFLAITALGICSSEAAAQRAETDRAKIEARLVPWRSDDAPGVAVAVMLDRETIYATGAGLSDLGHGVGIVPETSFHAASLTKQFTAFAVLSLVASGEIELDDDIRAHLPELAYRGPAITVQHLLDHMSGLREASSLAAMAGWRADDVFTEPQRFELLRGQTTLNFEPGAQIEYSNSGYALLAQLVERVSGLGLRDFLHQRVFEPLGMERTHLRTDLTEVVRAQARSYVPTDDGFARAPLNYEIVGSTGLQTTVIDLLIWADALNEHALDQEAIHQLMEARTAAANGDPAVLGRGQELRRYRGLETWSHGGRDAGFRAFLLRIPSEGFAIAILSNRGDFDTARLAFALIDEIFFSSPLEARPFDPATPDALAAYAGDYELFPGLIFSITTDGGALFFAPLGDSGGSPLRQIGERSFLLGPATDLSLAFDVPVDGRSSGFDWTLGLHGAIPAERVAIAPFDADPDLTAYAGNYASRELGVSYRVEATAVGLELHHHRLPVSTLFAYQPDTFRGDGPVGRAAFVRDEHGQVTGVLFSNPLAEDVLFERVG